MISHPDQVQTSDHSKKLNSLKMVVMPTGNHNIPDDVHEAKGICKMIKENATFTTDEHEKEESNNKRECDDEQEMMLLLKKCECKRSRRSLSCRGSVASASRGSNKTSITP